jgi:hypothetical protein
VVSTQVVASVRSAARARFADPVRAESAIDLFTSNAYGLVIEGESYRPRLKPTARQGCEGALAMTHTYGRRSREALDGSPQRATVPLLTAGEHPQAFRRPLKRPKCRQTSAVWGTPDGA